MRLLNDAKALFGVPGCSYLASVSLGAMITFEQRGLPFQDAFESAFDEVVQLHPLLLTETADLLQRRAVGIPNAWVVLCHILAGGLPRDVIRFAHRLLSARSLPSAPP